MQLSRVFYYNWVRLKRKSLLHHQGLSLRLDYTMVLTGWEGLLTEAKQTLVGSSNLPRHKSYLLFWKLLPPSLFLAPSSWHTGPGCHSTQLGIHAVYDKGCKVVPPGLGLQEHSGPCPLEWRWLRQWASSTVTPANVRLNRLILWLAHLYTYIFPTNEPLWVYFCLSSTLSALSLWWISVTAAFQLQLIDWCVGIRSYFNLPVFLVLTPLWTV